MFPVCVSASVGHCALRVAHFQQTDLAEVDVRKRVADEGIEPDIVDLHVEAAPPPAGTPTVCTPCWNCVMSPFTQASRGSSRRCGSWCRASGRRRRRRTAPSRRRQRVRDVLVRVPLNVVQSGWVARALFMSSDAGSETPSPFEHHSLATSTYSRSAFGSGVAGSTTIAPYIPFAMCAGTGLVPRWYM